MICLNRNEIMKRILHKSPMLLLDNVSIYDNYALGKKYISDDDFFFGKQ